MSLEAFVSSAVVFKLASFPGLVSQMRGSS